MSLASRFANAVPYRYSDVTMYYKGYGYMDIDLILLKSWLGVRSLGSPWLRLLGNRSSGCVFDFPIPSGVSCLVH